MGRTQKARPDSLRIKAAGVLWLRRFCATVALITASKGTVKSYVQNSLQAAEKALLYGFVADADGEFRVMTLADVSHTMPLASLGCTTVNISMCVRRIRERFFVSTASIVSIFPRGKTGELCVEIPPSGHFARLYQFLVRVPPSLPVFDTKLVGSFFTPSGRKAPVARGFPGDFAGSYDSEDASLYRKSGTDGQSRCLRRSILPRPSITPNCIERFGVIWSFAKLFGFRRMSRGKAKAAKYSAAVLHLLYAFPCASGASLDAAIQSRTMRSISAGVSR